MVEGSVRHSFIMVNIPISNKSDIVFSICAPSTGLQMERTNVHRDSKKIERDEKKYEKRNKRKQKASTPKWVLMWFSDCWSFFSRLLFHSSCSFDCVCHSRSDDDDFISLLHYAQFFFIFRFAYHSIRFDIPQRLSYLTCSILKYKCIFHNHYSCCWCLTTLDVAIAPEGCGWMAIQRLYI